MAKNEAVRHNKGKHRFSLVDRDALRDLIAVLEFGAKKYERDNWKNKMSLDDISDSLMRHLLALLDGELIDEDSGLPHSAHVMCNAMFLHYHERQ